MEIKNGLYIPETKPTIDDKAVSEEMNDRVAAAVDMAQGVLVDVTPRDSAVAIATLAAAILAQWSQVRKELEAAK